MFHEILMHTTQPRPVSIVFDAYREALEDEKEIANLVQLGEDDEPPAQPVVRPIRVVGPEAVPLAGPASAPAKQPGKKGRPSNAAIAAAQPRVASGPLDALFARKRERDETQTQQ